MCQSDIFDCGVADAYLSLPICEQRTILVLSLFSGLSFFRFCQFLQHFGAFFWGCNSPHSPQNTWFLQKTWFFQNSAMGFFCPMLFWVPYMFLDMEQRVAKMGIFDFLLGTIGYMCATLGSHTSCFMLFFGHFPFCWLNVASRRGKSTLWTFFDMHFNVFVFSCSAISEKQKAAPCLIGVKLFWGWWLLPQPL